jgi:DNA polymerase III subunit alpha
VNKKTLESLVYAGAFDCFPELHRGQYFFVAPGEQVNQLEKIIKFGNQYQLNESGNSNTLFGAFDMPSVVPPKIPNCEPWTLTEKLDFEKQVTGMFMSGHPLDHFKFEIKHYGITKIQEYNDIKDALALAPNAARPLRLAGLVVDAQHRVTKTGRQFGSFTIEDYSGKAEFMLWADEYTRFSNYLEKGKNLFMTGGFKQRFQGGPWEFKIERLVLLESIKQMLTKQVIIDVEARHLNDKMIHFMDSNIKSHPGRAGLKFNIRDQKEGLKVTLYTMESGFEMNEELSNWLYDNTDIDVQVVTA